MSAEVVAISEEVSAEVVAISGKPAAVDEDEGGFPLADLRSANMSGVNLEGEDMVGADLTGANLLNACFARTNLDGACLDEALLAGVDFTGANLAGCTFYQAIIDGGMKLRGNNPVLQVGPLNDQYIVLFNTYQGVFVRCNEFFGTIEAFVQAVEIQAVLEGLKDASSILLLARAVWKNN